MPATPARIGFILEEWRRSTATNAEVKSRHGTVARESADPIETFFDNPADAQAMAEQRLALLSPERRRFKADVRGLSEAISLAGPADNAPLARYVDEGRSADRDMLAAEIGFDFETQQATFIVWG
ncbi:hypothetical protein GRI39_01895 [Altererythrobacter indicus]|uniref:Uncharacterized protein n=1 Tax=Altericroceibacterium indicum TaxID=374177 RepID=A0A845AC95_9SPHN|nr:hypothetical protein [Altericroceibacterium indicum]MXP24798.1 hypothetical protein [Altericroceibacterium indicum]